MNWMRFRFFAFYIVSMVVVVTYQACSNSGDDFSCTDSDLQIVDVATTVSNCGLNDGSVVVTLSGGYEPFQYEIGGQLTDENTISGLSAGLYTLLVTDAKGCTTTASVQITSESSLEFTLEDTETDCGAATGTITVSASGGSGTYTYAVDGNTYQSSNVFTDLESGTYEVKVKDDEGCVYTELTEVYSNVSLANEIVPVINSTCAVSGCHSGAQSPNLSTKSGIMSNAANIKKQTQSGAMPKEGTISQENIDKIACWVDDGARDN